ncbi:TetR/AcrR family transcriptional regulator [Mycobacterium talmoniae]|uniref:TetR/AcrR family transcriptional regulator n=1 Tax=Mycobacterium talmoniae TaxID=1858794 RepID=UPI0009F167BB|nr:MULTISPECIES: TetR/AcrR family transcriptional regulator [Mycobacterium]TDH49357.1 TetR/AcrR family transcriptional regulator [Mycobacterium eburneum]
MPKKPRDKAGARSDKQDSKYARTRARILDAAAHILSVKGYAGTRLSDVAEQAQIQAPAIYYYFPSRDDLIEEVLYCGIADMSRYLQEVLDALPPETSPMDRILTAVEAHLRHELELSDYTTASIRNSGQVPEKLRKRQMKEEARYGMIWRRLFDNAAADGQIRPDLDPRLAQLLALGALNWTAEWWDPRRGSVDAVVRNAQTLVRHGLSQAPEELTAGPRKKRSSATRP